MGLLSNTVSLSPPSPVDASYETHMGSSQTIPGVFSQELFARGDGNEPLVPVADYEIAGMSYYAITDGSNPPYGKMLAGARATVFVRRSVAERLQQANTLLRPLGYELYIHDGWRSLATQSAIFVTYEQQYKDLHPGASDAEARADTLLYASDPSFIEYDPATVPLHATGGAVDVTLMRIDARQPLHIGTPFDNTTERASTAYFEYHAPSNPEEAQAAVLRRLLNAVMLTVGFTNYPKEWWHFDFGNRMYGAYCNFLRTNAPADVPGYSYIRVK